jgi:predicted dehydrogenase
LTGNGQGQLRVGVVGCGLIAQVMHLPHLHRQADRFEVVALCDISRATLDYCGERFFPGARRHTRWEDLLAQDLDAVMVLIPGSHAPIATAAAEGGMHVFVEKPVALSVPEGMAIVEAAERAGVCQMAGYMKRYEPAYERLVEHVHDLDDLRLVRVTTLEAPFEPYAEHHQAFRSSDADPELLEELRADDRRRVAEAIGEAADDPVLHEVYRVVLLDSLVHEFNMLRGVLGEPTELLFASVSGMATGVNTILRFGGLECVQAWSDLPGIVRYEQELAFYAPSGRAILRFPSPFLRNSPAALVTEGGVSGATDSWRSERIFSYAEAFERELVEFHSAIADDREPRTTIRDGLADVALCQAVIRCAVSSDPVENPTHLETALSGDSGA